MARASGWPALFWDAFKQSRNGMVLLDEQRCQVEVNPAYVELLGAHRSALLGRPVYEHIEDGPIVSAGEWRGTVPKEGGCRAGRPAPGGRRPGPARGPAPP